MLALSRLGQCAGEAVEEDAPAVGVLLGVLGLVDVLALERVEGALGDPQAGVVALGGEGELHEERVGGRGLRSEEHTSELQSLMRRSYAVFCLKKKIREDIRETKEHDQAA